MSDDPLAELKRKKGDRKAREPKTRKAPMGIMLGFQEEDEEQAGGEFQVKKDKSAAVDAASSLAPPPPHKRTKTKQRTGTAATDAPSSGGSGAGSKGVGASLPPPSTTPVVFDNFTRSSAGQYTPEAMNALKSTAIYVKTSSSVRTTGGGGAGAAAAAAGRLDMDTDDLSDMHDNPEMEANIGAAAAHSGQQAPSSLTVIDSMEVDSDVRPGGGGAAGDNRKRWQKPKSAMAGGGSAADAPLELQQRQIEQAKQKRRELRHTGEDFIPLRTNQQVLDKIKNMGDDTAVVSADGSTASTVSLGRVYGDKGAAGSGLVGEDVDDEDEQVFEGENPRRVTFGDPGREKAERRSRMRRIAGAMEEEEELRRDNDGEEEDDDALARWEAEQIKKGGIKSQAASGRGAPSASSSGARVPHYPPQGAYPPPPQQHAAHLPLRPPPHYPPYAGPGAMMAFPPAGRGYLMSDPMAPPPPPPPPSQVLPPSAPPPWDTDTKARLPSFAELQSKLRNRLSEMREVHTAQKRELDSVQTELRTTENHLSDAKASMLATNEQYLFFQAVRDEIVDTLECLHAKAPLVEEAMDELREIQVLRAKAVAELLALHQQDQEEEAFGPKSTEPREKKVDEFGRDLDYAADQGKARRRTVREAKAKRRQKRISEQGPSAVEAEGWSTDEEEEQVSSVYATKRRELEAVSGRIFEDVIDQFASFSSIQSRLQAWKDKYIEAYQEAHISLCVPALVAPYVRLELLKWRPLKQPQLSHMEWYNKLLVYGVDEHTTADDPDYNLVPRITEKIVVPLLIDVLQLEYDPFSLTNNEPAVEIVKDVICHIDSLANSSAMSELRGAVVQRLQRAVNGLAAPRSSLPAPPPSTDRSQLVQWQFNRRQWWRAVKLLTVATAWSNVVDEGALFDVCASLVLDHVLPHLMQEMGAQQQAAADIDEILRMLTRVLQCVPLHWQQRELANNLANPFLKLYQVANAFLTRLESGAALTNTQAAQVAQLRKVVRK